MTNKTELKEKTQVKIEMLLQGEDAERFLEYKNKEHLRSNTQAAYKLIMEGLNGKEEIEN